MAFAVLFPGQGSQFVGMGAELFDARPDLLGSAADEVLGWSLRSLCLDGPEEELTRTEHAQPALFATAAALWSELEQRLPSAPVAAAGHSLGEYTALSAAGALDYFDALQLVAARGAAMAAAADEEPSGMAALIGADAEQAEAIARHRRDEGGRLWVANLNAPGQVVLAGAAPDIEWLVSNARDLEVRRAVPLKVAGAFHSPLMSAAASQLEAAIEDVEFGPPAFPVWANVTASAHDAQIPARLVEQLTGPVRFQESLEAMAAAGADIFVHVGPGDVTAGLVKRSVGGAEPVVVSSLDDIDDAVARVSA